MTKKEFIEMLRKHYKKILLNKRETASELGVSQTTLDRMRNKGLISSSKISGKVLFRADDIYYCVYL